MDKYSSNVLTEISNRNTTTQNSSQNFSVANDKCRRSGNESRSDRQITAKCVGKETLLFSTQPDMSGSNNTSDAPRRGNGAPVLGYPHQTVTSGRECGVTEHRRRRPCIRGVLSFIGRSVLWMMMTMDFYRRPHRRAHFASSWTHHRTALQRDRFETTDWRHRRCQGPETAWRRLTGTMPNRHRSVDHDHGCDYQLHPTDEHNRVHHFLTDLLFSR